MLDYTEQQYLISENLLKPHWVINDYFGNELKNFLIGKLGFPDYITSMPTDEVLKARLIPAGLDLNSGDPVADLAVFIQSCFENDSINPTVDGYRRNHDALSSDYLICDGNSLFYCKERRVYKLLQADSAIRSFVEINSDVYIGGDFDVINDVEGNPFTAPGGFQRIAKVSFDRNTGEIVDVVQVGDGFDGTVFSLAKDSNDDLYAAGAFTNSGATPIAKVAKLVAGDWVALSSNSIANNAALVIKVNPIDDSIYVGCDGNPAPTDSLLYLFNSVGGTLDPVIFPAVTLTDKHLQGTEINDICFSDDGLKLAVVGNFNSEIPNVGEKFLIATIDNTNVNNVAEEIYFNGGGTTTIKKIIYSAASEASYLIASGNGFNVISYDNGPSQVTINSHLLRINNLFGATTFSPTSKIADIVDGIMDGSLILVGSNDTISDQPRDINFYDEEILSIKEFPLTINVGGAAFCPPEKPHPGDWRPLLNVAFDLTLIMKLEPAAPPP